MRFPLLAAVLLAASAFAPPAARGQVVEEKGKSKIPNAKLESSAISKTADGEAEALLRKKLAYCKKTGDCKAYMLEKEKLKKISNKPGIPDRKEPAAAVPEVPAGVPVPGEPAGAFVPAEALPGASADVPAPTAEQAEVLGRDAGERRERTMSRASGAADAMRRSFFPAQEAAPPGSAQAAPRSAPAPDRPRSVPELALAARSGYAVTFRDQGLKVGAGPRGEPAIQRADGTPAGEADLERLRAALRAEPEALIRRPDFFEVLPRGKFEDLKRDYAARPELRATAFKDVGLTAGARDFRWSSSCSGLSGSCNPHAAAGSYRKDRDVPPEDLDSIWSAAQEEILEDDEGFGEYTDEDRRLAAEEDLAAEKLAAARRSGPSLSSLLSRLGSLPRSLVAGAGSAPAPAVPEPSAPEARTETSAAARGGGREAGADPAPASGAAPPSGAPPAPEGRPGAGGRTGAYALAAAAAAALLLLAARRKA